MTQVHDCCPSRQGIGKEDRKSRSEFPHESGRHLSKRPDCAAGSWVTVIGTLRYLRQEWTGLTELRVVRGALEY